MNPKPVRIADCPPAFRIDNCVAMAHVVDVDAAATFYSRQGFDCESRYSHENGGTYFASMISGRAKLFLSLASGSIDASQQAVLFYMYSPDVSALRDHLLSRGLADGACHRECGTPAISSQGTHETWFF